MKAIILAAGRGVRLGPLTESIPKCLLKIGDKTILERQLKQFCSNGIKEFVLIVGYKKEQIKEEIKNLALPIKTYFIENEIYDKTNTIYSLWLAKEQAKEGFILISGDVVSDENIIKALVSYEGNVMVVDDNKKLGEEEMKVIIEDSKIKKIGKELKPENSHGEYTSILKFSEEASQVLFKELERFVNRNEINVYYEDAFCNIFDKVNIGILKTEKRRWTEVDFLKDYEEAKNICKELNNNS